MQLKLSEISDTVKLIGGIVVVLILLVAGIFGYHSWEVSKEQADFDKYIKDVSQIMQVKYKNFSVSFFTREVTVEGLTLIPRVRASDTATVDTLTYKKVLGKNDYIYSLDATITGLHNAIKVPNSIDPTAELLLHDLTNNELVSDINIIYRYREKEKDLMFKYQQKIHGLCQVGFGIMLQNIVLENITPMDAINIQLKQANFQYQDQSLFRVALDAAAKKKNMTKDQLIAQIKADLDKDAAKFPDPRVREFVIEFIKFLKDPQSITVTAKPLPPVDFSELQMTPPDHIMDRINLTITANQ